MRPPIRKPNAELTVDESAVFPIFTMNFAVFAYIFSTHYYISICQMH